MENGTLNSAMEKWCRSRCAFIAKNHCDEILDVAFPYFGGNEHEYNYFKHTDHSEIQLRKVPARKVLLANGESAWVASVFDLMVAHYGVDNGLGDNNVAKSFDDDAPYTPAWQEKLPV